MSLPFAHHPRYTIFVVLALCGVFYLLSPEGGPPHYGYLSSQWKEYDHDLPGRMDRAHHIYDRLLKDRQGLIKKHGPQPKDVINFPPDKAPWPPYTIWDYFPAAFNCPHEVNRLGALGDGGKWICGISRLAHKPDCVVYSFGINYESSFEAQVLDRTQDCQIYGYDFSVKSFGPEVPSHQAHRTHFHAFGLSGSDEHGPDDKPPMYTLESLLKLNGHKHIDLLKIDIEGWEFETLSTLLKPYIDSGEPLPFGQLSVEIHLGDKSFEYFLGWWEMLEAAGLRPFWTEPNLVYLIYNKKGTPDLAEYSFLNVKGDNIFIKDPPPSGHPHGPA